MLKGIFTFGLGVYTGIYVSQNYEIQKVDDPATMFNKLLCKLEELAKENSKK